MSDIVARDMLLEEKLARMEKMASLGVLASGVAHEINNPMGVILGYASHLQGKLDENDANYHFVREIKQESVRCVKIVQNLLNYARAPNLTKVPTDINVLLDQSIDFSAGQTDMHKVALIKEFGRNIPEVHVDRDQLRQVVINLILNAAAAMPQGGELVVATGVQNGSLLITFTDSGIGITEDDLKDVFEPFFTTKSKGTGLGLAISRQIVEAHLGTIEIKSVVAAGTTVVVRLPLT
jgi:two-component system NtrC family sensor kinase